MTNLLELQPCRTCSSSSGRRRLVVGIAINVVVVVDQGWPTTGNHRFGRLSQTDQTVNRSQLSRSLQQNRSILSYVRKQRLTKPVQSIRTSFSCSLQLVYEQLDRWRIVTRFLFGLTTQNPIGRDRNRSVSREFYLVNLLGTRMTKS